MERIYHPWHKWECFKAGFYNSSPPDGIEPEQAKESYRVFLADSNRFNQAMGRVSKEWVYSCGHFLSNDGVNRVAWLGQSAMCIETGIPSVYRGGFYLLSQREQRIANDVAETFLQRWVRTMEDSHHKVAQYIRSWRTKGYANDIPDDVPSVLASMQLAPSYRAIAIAILRNDASLQSLGFVPPKSRWYHELKGLEIRNRKLDRQGVLFGDVETKNPSQEKEG